MKRDYLKHEEFVWKDLIARAELAVRRIRAKWKKEQHCPRMIIAWPLEKIRTDNGTWVDLVTFAVPNDLTLYAASVKLIERIKPYGLLAIDRTETGIKVVLESPQGARCWHLPLRRHGDVMVLEKEIATADQECLGLLWRRSTGLN